MRRGVILAGAMMLVIGSVCAAIAGEPQKELQAGVDQIIALLQDKTYKDPGKEDLQRGKIMVVIKDIFDFVEVSKRSLGRYWKDFTPEERRDFTGVYAEFLGAAYFEKVKGAYRDETVVYLAENITSSKRAEVKTAIPRDAGDIPISYRMLKKKGRWRIYDVVIEGISLVNNYRSQFSKMLMRSSPAELIEHLRKKSEPQSKEAA